MNPPARNLDHHRTKSCPHDLTTDQRPPTRPRPSLPPHHRLRHRLKLISATTEPLHLHAFRCSLNASKSPLNFTTPRPLISLLSLFKSPSHHHQSPLSRSLCPPHRPSAPPLKPLSEPQPKPHHQPPPPPLICQKPHKNDTSHKLRDEACVRCRFGIGVLPQNDGGGGGELKIHPAIHPKIQAPSLKTRGFRGGCRGLREPDLSLDFRLFLFSESSRKSLGSLLFRTRRDRNSLARSSLVRALLSPPLCPLCSTSKAPGSEVSRPHRFGGSRGSRGREPCPRRSQKRKTHPVRVGLGSL